MRIAFIGLGKMGAPMARNLAAAGHQVKGYDAAGAKTPGVAAASSLQEAISACDAVITMLPDGDALGTVYADMLQDLAPQTLLIDCSTVDVATARAVASDAGQAGHLPLDAPVSGGTAGAAAGTLTFMVGGAPDAFAKAAPIFDMMGARAFQCGGSGAGQAAKICNNMILGISMIATCEACALADGLGLDRQALFDVVSASSGQSWSMTTYCPAPGIGPTTPADNNYLPGFSADLMLKDLTLSQKAAGEAGVATKLGEYARALYADLAAKGDGGRDFSAMLEDLTKAD